MAIEVYMIKVFYDHRKTPINKMLPVSGLDVGERIEMNNDGEWVIPNHYRSQKQKSIRQIGIRFVGEQQEMESVLLSSPDGTFTSTFIYSEEKDIWFEPTFFSSKKNGKKNYYNFDESSLVTGMTNAGQAKLVSMVGSQRNVMGSVRFIPSSLPMEEYEEMVAELYKIHEDLVRDNRNMARVGINSQTIVMELQEQLDKLTSAIQQISATPHAVLELQTTKKKPKAYGRFDMQMEIEKYMNPGKPSYRSRSLLPVTATYENKLIKQLLEDLVQYASVMGTQEPTSMSHLRNISNELDMYFRKSDTEIQCTLGSADMVEDGEIYDRVHQKYSQVIERYAQGERTVREAAIAKVHFAQSREIDQDMEYIELEVELAGAFTKENKYYHHLSSAGMEAYFKYAKREEPILSVKYVRKNTYSFVEPNSLFGEIKLNSAHVPSHVRFYRAFCEEAQKQSEGKYRRILIRGYVRKQPGGIDAVAIPTSSKYNKYIFEFAQILSIQLDGDEIVISEEKQDLLAFLEEELPVKVDGSDQIENAWMGMKQLEKLKGLATKRKEYQRASHQYDMLKETAERLLQLPLFADLELKERMPLLPTQVFLHNPTYRVAWQAVNRIKDEISVSLHVGSHQHQVSTAKVDKIFERWTLYKMIHLLTNEMGWKLDRSPGITASLGRYLQGGSAKASNVPPVKLHWNNWQVEIFYEPRMNLLGENYLTPDFVFKFTSGGRDKGMAILDAKYRDYGSQGEDQWVRDVQEVAIDKYGEMKPRSSKWDTPLLASGIIHSDGEISEEEDSEFPLYHVLYNDSKFSETSTEENTHKYNAIYMIPSKTYIFKNWFRLIMEYHLGEHSVCWNCGEDESVKERKLLTSGGHPKLHYECKACNEFWVKVHCNYGHKLIKHMNNYHLQEQRWNKWYVVCPSCGDGGLSEIDEDFVLEV
ncbi:nuclease domain-containing protein [Halobacillus sp. BAB-2008]|uniref:nuclease domain-containing protein n=1 Tax=Halobacillus sp. BAB-2008 TaxID=1246484 RepID=UPI0002A4D150|nr:nuclease domain-containing protein [Halobacillus sp. BAB-2008]ELK46303.1 hypothetical protein D479_11186 [Halobacillus sp. BAB-2008]